MQERKNAEKGMEGGRRREREREERGARGRLEDGVGERGAQKFGVHYSTLNVNTRTSLAGERKRGKACAFSLCALAAITSLHSCIPMIAVLTLRERGACLRVKVRCVYTPLYSELG